MENLLKIPIQLYSAQLICDHFEVSEEISAQGVAPTPLSSKDEIAYEVKPKDIMLIPSQRKKVSFEVKPRREGLLEIRGIGFSLSGLVWCRKQFPLKSRKLQNTLQQRVSGAVEVNINSSIQIVSSMPQLQLDFPAIPNTFYLGEIRKYFLTFKNIGKEALKNVAIKLSHPGFFSFSDKLCEKDANHELDSHSHPFFGLLFIYFSIF